MANFPESSAVADPSALDVRATYFRLLGYAVPFLSYFLFSVFGFALFAISMPMLPALLEQFLDAINDNFEHPLWMIPVWCIGIGLLRSLGSYLGNYYMGKAGAGVVHAIRCEPFERLVRLPMGFFDQNKTGNLVSLFTYNATALTQSVTKAITVIVRDGFVVIALSAYMFYMNWKLTLIFLLVGPLVAIVIAWVGKQIKKLGKGIQASMAEINHVANEMFGSIRDVKSAASEMNAADRFSEASQSTRRNLVKMTKVTAIFAPVMQLLVIVALAVVMYVALLVRDTMDANALAAYIAAAGILPKHAKSLASVYSQILQGVVAADEAQNHRRLRELALTRDGEHRHGAERG